jgi:hypothetical protein
MSSSLKDKLFCYLRENPIPDTIGSFETVQAEYGRRVQFETLSLWVMHNKVSPFGDWLMKLVQTVQQRKGAFYEPATNTTEGSSVDYYLSRQTNLGPIVPGCGYAPFDFVSARGTSKPSSTAKRPRRAIRKDHKKRKAR